MSHTTDVLFRPLTIGTLTIPNRVVMAPMTRSFSIDGVPGEDVATYYRRRAEGGVGLILSEGTIIYRPAAKNEPNVPDFYRTESLSGWQRVIDEVHQAGGRMGPSSGMSGLCRTPHRHGNCPSHRRAHPD